MQNLTGRLLIAVPSVSPHAEPEVAQPQTDPVVDPVGPDLFERSVVLVLHHDDADGAHGLVLNRPLPAEVDAVLPGWQEHVVAPGQVFQGGPVELDSALGLVSVPGLQETLGIKRLFGAVGLVDLDAPPEVVMPEVAAMRIFAGYAGWEAGQLEREIRSGNWFVVEAENADPFCTEPGSLWTSVLRRQPGTLAVLSTFPADPSMN